MEKLKIFYALAIMLCFANISPATAKDSGQWENMDPVIRQWYSQLKQPDNPTQSCCGEGDAYWCDEIHIRRDAQTGEAKTYCTITDDRDDEPLRRIHVPVGTEIYIPNHKLTWKDGNPTGHAIVFLWVQWMPDNKPGYNVYCFVQNGGT